MWSLEFVIREVVCRQRRTPYFNRVRISFPDVLHGRDFLLEAQVLPRAGRPAPCGVADFENSPLVTSGDELSELKVGVLALAL
jgi:hypothetical protein